MTSKVSFTVRRPSPPPRDVSSGPESDPGTFRKPALPKHLTGSAPGSPLARSTTSSPHGREQATFVPSHDYDSSDDDFGESQDELVTGFDRFGVERKDKPRQAPRGPLVIPALQNRDWREVARKRKTGNQYIPGAGRADTGADGSVGGLGTKDTINSGPQLSGLQVRVREPSSTQPEAMDVDEKPEEEPTEPESEDQAALKAILAEASGQTTSSVPTIILGPVSEEDALKQDVADLPDSASLDDYARVPVEQFGAALLRGMGWKEGMAASRKPGKGLVEPYLPEARPALLGIGAKEREPLDDGSTKRKGRPDKKYVPLIKQETEREGSSRDRRRERSRSPNRRYESSSRRTSRSPPPKRRENDYGDERRSSSRRDDRDRDRDRGSDRDRNRDRDRDRDRDRRKEYTRDRRSARSEEREQSSRRY